MENAITSTEAPGHVATEQPGEPERPSLRGRFERLLQPVTLLVLLALLPPLLMARRVHQAAQLNYQDYWPSMLRIANPDGSLHLRGIFTYQNEHPFVIPQTVFYLDAKLLQGTNHELGYFSWLMGLVSLGLLWLLFPRSWSPLTRGLLLLASSMVLFCPSGAWNFVRGMSGVAWLTANVFALLAVLLATRRRTVLAVLACAVALLTYGTGFGAPVAIIVVALLNRDKRWRWLLPLGLLLGAVVVYAATSQGGTSGAHGHDPALLTQTFLTNIATMWEPAGGSPGLLIGAAGLAVLVWCALRYWALRDSLAELIPWWGVAVYSLAASALISLGRSQTFDGNGAQGRYVSLSALFWIALAVIAIRLVSQPRELVARGLAAAAAVLVFWGASPSVFANAIAQAPGQDLAAAGLRYGAASPFATNVYQPQQQAARLQKMGDYPFSSDYSPGCGLKPDATVDLSRVRSLPAGMFPKFGVLDGDTVTGDVREVNGWIFRLGHPTECAILVDPSGKVVGAGSAKIQRSDVAAIASNYPPNAGFEAVTPAANTDATLLLGFDDGFFTLPPSATPPPADATPAGK
ncbi:MAG TPA: hypothetical protein VMB79_08400 [Jatrophihabitans sp.]|nr:hypothetical protein [Jatrophihabitans sp.]